MKKQLAKQNIVITGASSGIGALLAKKVAEQGDRPILIARSEEKLQTLCQTIYEETNVDCKYYKLDVSKFSEVETVFQTILTEVGPIDILVNNAGFGIFDTFHDANFNEIIDMFDVNVLGLFACTKAVLPAMLERNRGHIINIASQAGKIATPKSSVYSATKHAVLGFTNSLRLELADTNIHISAVNPGPIATNFFDKADKSGNYVKNVGKYMLDADKVATKIVQLMIKPRRELNLPFWMNYGSVLFHLFPHLFEKIAGKFMNMK